MTTSDAITKFHMKMMDAIAGTEEQKFSTEETIRAISMACEEIKDELLNVSADEISGLPTTRE